MMRELHWEVLSEEVVDVCGERIVVITLGLRLPSGANLYQVITATDSGHVISAVPVLEPFQT
jgi:hypothetical protein